MKILAVQAGSVGDELGIRAGDELVAVNGFPVTDILDYEYILGAERFTMTVARGDEQTEFDVEKYEDEDIGLDFDREIPPRTCKNHCLFCFVDQLPERDLRKTLHIKDDDYRHSFLSGNYITMTNMTDADIDRVLRLKLSPLYVSVHSADEAVRRRLLGVKRAPDLMAQVRRLHAGGIKLHGQIVYCPGINDDYAATARATAPYFESLAVVPVGLTRDRNPLLTPVSPPCAAAVIDAVEALQPGFLADKGTRYVFAADEFYTICGREVPPYEAYEDFPQIENGVGLIARFLREFSQGLTECSGRTGACSIATGVSAYPLIRRCADEIAAKFGGDIRVYAVRNDFFGETVTVAGLVTGGDIAAQLAGKPLGDRLYIPSVMLREFGDVFLDDMHVSELSRRLGVPVIPVPADGGSFVKYILDGGGTCP